MSAEKLPSAEVSAALHRVLASDAFAAVGRLSKFLKYVVETTLEGKQSQIKETVIAIEVYGRDVEFDPRTNPLVRVDASRLRRRLKEYYAEEGKADELRIELPKGTYVPRFVKLKPSFSPDYAHFDESRYSKLSSKSLPCVAVLEFDSPDTNRSYIGRGLADEIKNRLHRFADLRVVVPYASTQDEMLRQMQDSGADYVLSGSVKCQHDQVRVIAELRTTKLNEQLWSERWDRTLSSSTLFELQDDIAERTVGNVASPYGAISRDRLKQTAAVGPLELGSFEWTVKYYRYQRGETSEENHQLRSVFREIVAREPEYAQAWAISAHLELDSWRLAFDESTTKSISLELADAHAARALSLDPANTLALTVQAGVCAHLNDLPGLEKKAAKIIEVNPCDGRAIGWIGMWYAMFERWEIALEYAQHARDLNPLDVSTSDIAEVYYAIDQGDYQTAWSIMEGYQGLAVYWADVFVIITAYLSDRQDLARLVMSDLMSGNPNLDIVRDLRKYPFRNNKIALFKEIVEEVTN